MRVPDDALEHLAEHGYMVVEGFLGGSELAEAQEALWEEFPRPAEYFAAPEVHAHLQKSQFAGVKRGPFESWALNRLTFHPDLVDAVERFLGSTDLRLYKAELWAKYSGGIDYDQALHRDYGNHSLVVPKATDPARQMTSFILLSDVTEDDGPTKVVSKADGQHVPYWPHKLEPGVLADKEISVTGPAGTLFSYRSDILHRGSAMTAHPTSRFALLADYEAWGSRWTGKIAWPDKALTPGFAEIMERATPREREIFGFPAVGDPYWDPQTLADVHARYPHMDMSPYIAASDPPEA